MQTRRAIRRAAGHVRIQFNRTGFDLSREPFRHRFVPIAQARGIDTVLDVGASKGQFGRALRRAGFRGRIISVEPLVPSFTKLSHHAEHDRAWQVERAAVSDTVGSITMNVAANAVSSSVLPMLEVHTSAAPQSRYVATEQVPATTVDDLVHRHGLRPEKTLLKIDVQGYEQAVLDGAAETLPRIGGIRMELSLVALYDGQSLMSEMLERMAAVGLELWMIEPGFADPASGRLLQLDGVFFPSAERG